ncbi:unnamed protein product [Gongylonema pulchrum]|uniref:KIX domain-containing protein n=1 Tax=Gongylonema pulchrum TaxID=637853 RepID=A0A183DBM6_9BILA|nr:unnamed protein product [Gongylonema pulchrum]
MSSAPDDTISITELSCPETPKFTKPWHEDVFSKLRSYIIVELVRAIYPTFESAIKHDPRTIEALFETMRETELVMFENSNDEV